MAEMADSMLCICYFYFFSFFFFKYQEMPSTCTAQLPSGIMAQPKPRRLGQGPGMQILQTGSAAGPASQLAPGTRVTPQKRTENKASGSFLFCGGADAKRPSEPTANQLLRRPLPVTGKMSQPLAHSRCPLKGCLGRAPGPVQEQGLLKPTARPQDEVRLRFPLLLLFCCPFQPRPPHICAKTPHIRRQVLP